MNLSAALDPSLLEFDLMLLDQSSRYEPNSQNVPDVTSTVLQQQLSPHQSIDTMFYSYQMYDGTEFLSAEGDLSDFATPQLLPGVSHNSPPPQPVMHYQNQNGTPPAFGQVDTASNGLQFHPGYANNEPSQRSFFPSSGFRLGSQNTDPVEDFFQVQTSSSTNHIQQCSSKPHGAPPDAGSQFSLAPKGSASNESMFNPVASLEPDSVKQDFQFGGPQAEMDCLMQSFNIKPEMDESAFIPSFLEESETPMQTNTRSETISNGLDSSTELHFPSSASFSSLSDSGSLSPYSASNSFPPSPNLSTNMTDLSVSSPAHPRSSPISISISPLFLNPAYEEVGLLRGGTNMVVTETSYAKDSSSTLCPICGNEAGRHVHYGGKACTSCRAFFRRSVQNDAYKSFTCTAKGRCKIDSKSWRSCRWCRYQKCLASGMKPGWVLNEIERHIRHEKRTSGNGTKKRLSTEIVPIGSNSKLNGDSPLWSFTLDEQNQLFEMLDSWRKKMMKHVMKFYSSNQFLFKELLSALYYRTTVPFEIYQNMECRWKQMAHQIVSHETVLNTLSSNDCDGLLRHNLPILHVFMQFILLGNQQQFKNSAMAEVLMRLITLQIESDIEDEMRTLNKIMRELKVGQNLPDKAITYEQVFTSPWAESLDIEERHEQLMHQISPWPIDNTKQDQSVDKVLVFLLAHVIMLSTDTFLPKDSATISKLQDNHLSMLHRYLKFKYKRDANTKLADGIMITQLAKEARDIRLRRLPV